MKPSVWPRCLLVFVLGLAGLAGCSKPEERVQAPPKADPVAEQPQATVDIPEIQLSTDSETKNLGLFKEYAGQLRAGDLMQASANLATLKSHLKGEDLNDPFWIGNLPLEHRVILLIGALCTACPDGACPTCKGHSDCQICKGTGLCTLCAGSGGEWKPCLNCICKTCQGRRFCPSCMGRRYQPCSTCKGSGNGREERTFAPCANCKGQGYQEGLKGANGTSTKYKCLRCNGAKGVYSTKRFPCAGCDGTGQKKCETCRGTGVCPACRGLGRMSTCKICGGQGRFLEPCTACKGAKACPVCSGTKLCQTCKGQGVCHECLGRNLVIRHRFPIDRRWLEKPDMRVFYPGQDGVRSESLTVTTTSLTINGRNISSDVPEGSLLWASAPEDLRRIKDIFKPEP